MSKKKIAVIGSGFGGLAAAIRLQAAGFNVTLFEKRDLPGGRAYVFKDNGFTFDAGPTVITAPHCIEELFEIAQKKMDDYIELLPVTPFYRLKWADDGYEFDYTQDMAETLKQIEKKNPEDAIGYQKFLEYSKEVFHEGYTKLVDKPFLNFWSMVKVAPKLVALRADRNVFQTVGRYIKDKHLREAFSFHSLLVGGNPFNTSSIYTLIHYLERNWGVYFPKGGTGALVQALVKLFQDLGGQIHLNSEIDEILTQENKVCGLKLKSGEIFETSSVVSNADVVHTYDRLLKKNDQAKKTARRLKKKRHSMSLFLIYFGTKKQYPEIAHHTVLFGPRYKELLHDIFEKGILPKDFSLYLHAPTRTDPSLAPAGHEGFYVLSPVSHQGKLKINWKEEGPKYRDTILDYLEKTCLPGLKENLVTSRIFTPEDFTSELNAHLGSAFSLEPTLLQSAYFRVHNEDAHIKGLYFVGAGTHPGAGLPGVINSGKATANHILSKETVDTKKAAEMINKVTKSFSISSKVFSEETKNSAHFLYSWCRYVDDQIDGGDFEEHSLENKRERLNLIRTKTKDAFSGKTDDFIYSALKEIALKYNLSQKHALDLLEGMEWDLEKKSIETESELLEYCYYVAGTVGLMMAKIMTVQDERAFQHAKDLGIAFQLTNISRDFLTDAKMGRCYIPVSWRSKNEIIWDKNELVKIAEKMLALAEKYYASGMAGIPYLGFREACAIQSAALIYREIGIEVLKRGVRAWDSRVYISTPRKLFLLVKGVLRVLSYKITGIKTKPLKALPFSK